MNIGIVLVTYSMVPEKLFKWRNRPCENPADFGANPE